MIQMKRTRTTMMIGRWWEAVWMDGKWNHRYGGVRMVGKASNRAGVHGSKLPPNEIIDNEEEVREKIEKGKEEKENKRREVEKAVGSKIDKNSGD